MKKESVWKVGESMQRIQLGLQMIIQTVDTSPNIYLDDESLEEMQVNKEDWDLTDTDEFFACLPHEDFAKLMPTEPDDQDFVPYEQVEPPKSAAPHSIWGRERSAREILQWFEELQYRKVSVDGRGFFWPCGASSWAPRNKLKYENLYDYARTPPSVPWYLFNVYTNDDKPHHIYHAWHGDEGKDGAILQSELFIIARCMKGRMAAPTFCDHNVPVSLHSFLNQSIL